jgi:uncharacterized protein YraI
MLINVRTGTITVPASDTVTAGTVTEVLSNAQFGNTVVQVPALEGTGTAVFRMIDNLLGTINEITTDESTTKLGTPVFNYYSGTLTLTATTTNATDGTQSAARNVVYNIYYRTRHG